MTVNVTGGVLSEEEKNTYVRYICDKYKNRRLRSLDINIDGDYVDLNYHFEPENFERIRRITGYLVGTLDNWNDGKRAEEHDRVKHDISVMERI